MYLLYIKTLKLKTSMLIPHIKMFRHWLTFRTKPIQRRIMQNKATQKMDTGITELNNELYSIVTITISAYSV